MLWRWLLSGKDGRGGLEMSPEEHNRLLGYGHLAYAGFQTLMMGMVSLFMFFMFALGWTNSPPSANAPPLAFFVLIMAMIFVISLLFTLPSYVAGYGLLKKKSWARTWAIVAGVLASMSFPIGTAVAVHTFWFLFGEAGKDFYSKSKDGIGQRTRDKLFFEHQSASADASAWTRKQREEEYVPPPEMPNWRD
jgi:hypothetical protein